MGDKTNSAYSWADVTPSNSAWMEPRPAGVFVGGAGDVVAEGADGVTATFTVPAGVVLPIQPRRILSSGTTATALVALYN